MKSPKKSIGETIEVSARCSCKHNKKFKFPVEVIKKAKSTETQTIHTICPFHHEEGCVINVNIEIPEGTRPVNNKTILRGQ